MIENIHEAQPAGVIKIIKPIDKASKRKEAIEQAILDSDIIIFGPQVIKIDDPYSSELVLPEKFKLLFINFKGLKLKVISQDDLILWECHFGVNGADHRNVAIKKGISDLDTFKIMYEDFKRLSELLEQFPVMKPNIVFAGRTNYVMYDFLKKVFPEVILEDIAKPRDSLIIDIEKEGWREDYFVFDTALFIDLVNEAKNSGGFVNFARSRRAKTKIASS